MSHSLIIQKWFDEDLEPPVAGGGVTVSVPLGTLTLTGFAPTVINPKSVLVPLGTLTLTGFAPLVKTPRVVQVPLGTLTLTGFAPNVFTPRTVSIPLGTLTLTAFAPTVVVAGGAVFLRTWIGRGSVLGSGLKVFIK